MASSSAADASSDTGGGTVSPTPAPLLVWRQCDNMSNGFDCATLVVPWCHDNACNTGTIELPIIHYDRAKRDDAPSVWVVEDSIKNRDFEAVITRVSNDRNANIFAVASRHAALAQVPESWYRSCLSLVSKFATRLPMDAPSITAIEDCHTWLTTKYGTQRLSVFSLGNAAMDLHMAMQTVQDQMINPASSPSTGILPWYVYSVSASSRMVQRLVALDMKNPRYTIRGLTYEKPSLMKLPANFDALPRQGMAGFLENCKLDLECRDHFREVGKPMAEALTEMYDILDTDAPDATRCMPVLKNGFFDASRDAKPSHGLRRGLAWLLARSPNTARLIGPVVLRAWRCGHWQC